MKNVSADYKEQFNRAQRNRSYVRVVFNQIDAEARTDGTYSNNGDTDYSEMLTVDSGYKPETTYATLEPDRFLLDGTQDLLPDSDYHNEGFVGDALSGSDGIYELPRPTLTKEFTEKHSIVGMTVLFDGVLGEYPKHVIIRFYSGGAQIFYLDIDNISSSELVFEQQISSFDKYSIEFVQSYLPYRRARVQSVLYGVERIFENDRIESTTQVSDVDPLARRLPTETLSFTILDYDQEYNPENPTGRWEYVDTQSPISIQYGYKLDSGEIEWLAPDYYLLDGKPSVQNNRATFTATKLLGYMTGTYYKSTTGTKTLYDMAEDVLEDADLPLTEELTNPWYIDPSLADISTDAVLPIDTHRNCLQLIAHAGMCRLYTDADGIVRIEKFQLASASDDFLLDFSSAWNKPVVSKTEPLYSVNVLKYTNIAEAESSQLHESTFTVSGTALFYAEFEAAQDVNISIVGGTLSNVNVYARAVTATITASGEVTVTITGKKINTTTSGVPYVVSADDKGEEEVVENPLVTTNAHKLSLEEHLADYLAFRATYSMNYRGNPELEAGDLISMQSQFSSSFPVLVLKQSVSFSTSISGSGIFKGVWFKKTFPYYAGEIYAGDTIGVI